MAKRQSLGRGLGALIPDVSRETNSKKTPPVSVETSTAPPTNRSTALPPKKPIATKGAANTQTVDQPQAIAGLTFAELAVGSIVPNAQQPRQVFDDEALAELVHSITEVGLLQPIVVRPAPGGGYELVAGERRLRATKKAGFKTIPALIRETGDDQMLRDALLENLHRAALTPLEEAAAYKQLLEDFGGTQEELATRLGRSRP